MSNILLDISKLSKIFKKLFPVFQFQYNLQILSNMYYIDPNISFFKNLD